MFAKRLWLAPALFSAALLANAQQSSSPQIAGFSCALAKESPLAPRELLVTLDGHFDYPPPVSSFALSYRLNLNGTAVKLFQQEWNPGRPRPSITGSDQLSCSSQ